MTPGQFVRIAQSSDHPRAGQTGVVLSVTAHTVSLRLSSTHEAITVPVGVVLPDEGAMTTTRERALWRRAA